MKALVVAAGIVFWTLVLGIAWLAFFPGSDAGEPVAILQIEPGPAGDDGAGPAEDSAETPDQGAASVPSEAARGHRAGRGPCGFRRQYGHASRLRRRARGKSRGTNGPAAWPGADDAFWAAWRARRGARSARCWGFKWSSGRGRRYRTDGLDRGARARRRDARFEPDCRRCASTSSLNLPAVEPGAGSLEPVPVAELVEDSQYGPLPKVASDGRRPLDVYARPSRYAAKGGAGDPARIAILVTGLGLADSPPANVLKGLPPSISVAYGAYGRSLQDGVTVARADGHEVLLQIPLEPNNYPTENPGPHTLLTTLPPDENMKRLEWLMSRYTGYVGVTNLMGAKFEATQNALTPVLEEVKSRGLLYVDDGSVQGSTAGQIASTIGLDYSVATVQINDASPADIAKQLAKLEAEAKEKGAAIGVVKAKPATLKQIAEWASKLQSKGFVLVPVSAVVRSQSQS